MRGRVHGWRPVGRGPLAEINLDEAGPRRWLAVAAAALLGAVATITVAAPASAAPTTSFGNSEGTVWGTITWRSSYSLTVSGTIYGYDAGPGYQAAGFYFGAGSGKYECARGGQHNNYADGIERSSTDALRCSVANIQQVDIWYYHGSSIVEVGHFGNPLAR